MPARISRGLSRKGRRLGGGSAAVGPLERRGAIDVMVAGMVPLGDERELGLPEHAAAVPRPQEPRIARPRVGAHADVVLAVGLERRRVGERHLLEMRQPAAHRLPIFGGPRLFHPAVDGARDLIAPCEVIEPDAGLHGHRRDLAVEQRRPAPQLGGVRKLRRQSAQNRIVHVRGERIGQVEGHQHLAIACNRGDGQILCTNRSNQDKYNHEDTKTRKRKTLALLRVFVSSWLHLDLRLHSLAFNRSFNSVMNSPMSRKCRYTDANRTYATLSSFFNSSMTNAPMSAVAISFSGRSCSAPSTRSAIASRPAALTGRLSHALSRPATSFCRSNRSRVPSFFTTMYGISSIRS